ncbi:MAG: sigma-70 family RNA polymerase sigma factor [Polyangiales bacterium]
MTTSLKENRGLRAIIGVFSRAHSQVATVEPEVDEQPDVQRAPTRAEFDALYRANADFVWRSLRRLGVPPASLDDATQEVFIVVHRRFHELRPGPTQRAWLFAIAQRVASGHRRWVRRKGNLLPLHEEMVASTGSPLDNAIRTQGSELLLEFLSELDEPRRVAFILAELEQMTGAEAHAASGVNQNTLYARLVSARKALTAFIVRRGLAPNGEEEP